MGPDNEHRAVRRTRRVAVAFVGSVRGYQRDVRRLAPDRDRQAVVACGNAGDYHIGLIEASEPRRQAKKLNTCRYPIDSCAINLRHWEYGIRSRLARGKQVLSLHWSASKKIDNDGIARVRRGSGGIQCVTGIILRNCVVVPINQYAGYGSRRHSHGYRTAHIGAVCGDVLDHHACHTGRNIQRQLGVDLSFTDVKQWCRLAVDGDNGRSSRGRQRETGQLSLPRRQVASIDGEKTSGRNASQNIRGIYNRGNGWLW